MFIASLIPASAPWLSVILFLYTSSRCVFLSPCPFMAISDNNCPFLFIFYFRRSFKSFLWTNLSLAVWRYQLFFDFLWSDIDLYLPQFGSASLSLLKSFYLFEVTSFFVLTVPIPITALLKWIHTSSSVNTKFTSSSYDGNCLNCGRKLIHLI